ncbi:hypothetical protein Tco_0910404 [Tanacetum coccineum]|uniref:Uncharacterized protein n=1 Tax=Tanacetum coccineum TaxID=301880 RepID=A0ABQ5CZX8_9ASTR
MESSTFSQPNRPYSPINHTNLDMNFEKLIFSQDYIIIAIDYSMSHGSGSWFGSRVRSAQSSDEVDLLSKRYHPSNLRSPRDVQQGPKRMSPRSRRKIGQWRKRPRCAKLGAMCQKIILMEIGRKKSKTSETTSGSASGGLNLNEEVDEDVEETQEF